MSSRKSALPGLQRDVDALLSNASVTETDASAAPWERATALPSAAAAPVPFHDGTGDARLLPTAPASAHVVVPVRDAPDRSVRGIDHGALMELASQYPSTSLPIRAPDAQKSTAPAESMTPLVEASPPSPTLASTAGPADNPGTVGAGARGDPMPQSGGWAGWASIAARLEELEGAIFGSQTQRRWLVAAGVAVIGLLVVVLVGTAFLSPATTLNAGPADPAAVAAQEEREAMRTRVAEMQRRLDAVEASSREAGRSVAALRDQVSLRMDGVAKAGDVDATRLALMSMRLEAVASTGRPFAKELAAARAAAGTHGELAEALARLHPFAESGVPTRRDLASRVSAQAPRIAAVSSDAGAEGVLDWVGGIFSRKPSSESITSAVLARTQAELDAGDLGAAVRQLQRLPGPQRQAAMSWIIAAERRLSMDAAFAELTTVVFRAIAKAH